MRFFYVVPRKVLDELHHLNGEQRSRHALFKEFHYLALGEESTNGLILLSGEFHSDWHQEAWHLHGHVGRLQHPHHERGIPLEHLHQREEHAHKNFTEDHCKSLCSRLGLAPEARLSHVHEAARAINPQVRLNSAY